MKKSLSLSLFLASSVALVAASPVLTKRGSADLLVLRFADVLEQLEDAFYAQAIDKFKDPDFTSAGFASSQIPVEQFITIRDDEKAHSTALEAVIKSLRATPIRNCSFNFDAVLTDAATMAATARVIENVGVGAYLGAAHLISDPALLTAAGSILTVEARHQTVLNILSGTGTAIPAAFDIALSPPEVLALAGPLFKGQCDLGVPANPTLAITNSGAVAPGTHLTFRSTALNSTASQDKLYCQMLVGGSNQTMSFPFNQCVVPNGINGPVAIFITWDSKPLLNNVIDRGSNKVVAGPALAFIDTHPQKIGQLVRPRSASSGSGSSSGNSTSASAGSTVTCTISPSAASSILQSASSTATASSNPMPSLSASASAGGKAEGHTTFIGSPGGPNFFTGKTPSGVTVVGWTNLPESEKKP
ncbi:hypothetical protein AX17_004963 [Amanita inopinata Kibby_2008]|nr:hypothetical protein AX17_004963 [Amanita inopinata Kibby_2008]